MANTNPGNNIVNAAFGNAQAAANAVNPNPAINAGPPPPPYAAAPIQQPPSQQNVAAVGVNQPPVPASQANLSFPQIHTASPGPSQTQAAPPAAPSIQGSTQGTQPVPPPVTDPEGEIADTEWQAAVADITSRIAGHNESGRLGTLRTARIIQRELDLEHYSFLYRIDDELMEDTARWYIRDRVLKTLINFNEAEQVIEPSDFF
ncbi:hypothetical protein BLS_005439 [Venturia inaequalis]|uniref:Uncharacterized protein n=1 Tax=Venturia inaequalis TaxID=5025 RepID=A0A8H3YU45_VENIN|nr:hypothetical protein EG328_009323 [Venturia inaequalis]KAE9969251.1 hypothetical protein BLS_005439 [Venturia inaequalis]